MVITDRVIANQARMFVLKIRTFRFQTIQLCLFYYVLNAILFLTDKYGFFLGLDEIVVVECLKSKRGINFILASKNEHL